MKKSICIIVLTYFCVGNIMLPCSDFQLIAQLPSLYQHCRLTEHADMNLVDFLTDHLINIDGLFDAHSGDDDQKPHRPFTVHSVSCASFLLAENKYRVCASDFTESSSGTPKKDSYSFLGVSQIFRPPIS